jgi:hypothetical protein
MSDTAYICIYKWRVDDNLCHINEKNGKVDEVPEIVDAK